MQIRLEWDPAYELGHEVIDRQHRNIVALADAISEMDDTLVVQQTVMELFRHTREHFRDEEELMRSIGYPDLDAHRKIHEELIESLGRITSQPIVGPQAIRSFRLFVYKWVIEHLMDQDRQLIDSVRSRPGGAAAGSAGA